VLFRSFSLPTSGNGSEAPLNLDFHLTVIIECLKTCVNFSAFTGGIKWAENNSQSASPSSQLAVHCYKVGHIRWHKPTSMRQERNRVIIDTMKRLSLLVALIAAGCWSARDGKPTQLTTSPRANVPSPQEQNETKRVASESQERMGLVSYSLARDRVTLHEPVLRRSIQRLPRATPG